MKEELMEPLKEMVTTDNPYVLKNGILKIDDSFFSSINLNDLLIVFPPGFRYKIYVNFYYNELIELLRYRYFEDTKNYKKLFIKLNKSYGNYNKGFLGHKPFPDINSAILIIFMDKVEKSIINHTNFFDTDFIKSVENNKRFCMHMKKEILNSKKISDAFYVYKRISTKKRKELHNKLYYIFDQIF
jgi:hypothetical protein